jgi:hypothetical protein
MTWTHTHYYRFPNQAVAEALPMQEPRAIDPIGPIAGTEGWHVNARWWGVEPEAWETYRLPPPAFPKRVFA